MLPMIIPKLCRIGDHKYLHTTEENTMPQLVEPTTPDAQREIIRQSLDEIAAEVATSLCATHIWIFRSF